MAADFAIITDLGAFLNLNECADSGIIANLTAVKINEAVNNHVSAESHIRRHSAKVWRWINNGTG